MSVGGNFSPPLLAREESRGGRTEGLSRRHSVTGPRQGVDESAWGLTARCRIKPAGWGVSPSDESPRGATSRSRFARPGRSARALADGQP